MANSEAKKVDPNGRDLGNFMDVLGCFHCERKNNGQGTYKSIEDMKKCASKKDEIRRAHENHIPMETFDCELKIIAPSRYSETRTLTY